MVSRTGANLKRPNGMFEVERESIAADSDQPFNTVTPKSLLKYYPTHKNCIQRSSP